MMQEYINQLNAEREEKILYTQGLENEIAQKEGQWQQVQQLKSDSYAIQNQVANDVSQLRQAQAEFELQKQEHALLQAAELETNSNTQALTEYIEVLQEELRVVNSNLAKMRQQQEIDQENREIDSQRNLRKLDRLEKSIAEKEESNKLLLKRLQYFNKTNA